MAKKKVRKGVRILAWIATLPVLVLGVGWIFHTSFEPDVLGKYSWGYFTFLLCWWLLVTPAVYYFARFLFDTHRIELTSGRVLHVRPSLKILLALLLSWGMVEIVTYRVDKELGRGVTTAQGTDIYHPYLQNVPRKRNRFNVNKWGFRGHGIEKRKPENAYRIFTLGGSTTFSVTLKLPDTYQAQLAEKLSAAHPERKIEVQNAGGDWHCSQHSLIKYLTSIQDFDPDLLIVFHGINDLGRSLSPTLFSQGAFREDYRHFLGPVSSLVKKDRFTYLRMKFGHWFSDFLCHKVRMMGPHGTGVGGLQTVFFSKAEPVEVDDWPSLATYERTMRDLILVATAKGTRIIIATQPFLYRDDLSEKELERLWTPISHQWDGKRVSLGSITRGMERINALTAQIAAQTDAGFVDLESLIPKTTEYLYDDMHHTKKATTKIAAAFYEYIQTNKLLDR